jgi:hypothetical protein
MARNPKNPRLYTKDPRGRADEKLNIILKMLVDFHHSTKELMLQRLSLATDSHHQYFKKLEEKGILKKIEAPSIRNNFVYMLTAIGIELATERLNLVVNYQLDGHKINHNNLRHDLAIQKIMISKIDEYDYFVPERFLSEINISNEKQPDGCFIKNNKKTVLEVELTAKTDRRIHKAFISHAKAVLRKDYENIIYVFSSTSTRNYYFDRFNEKIWKLYIYQNDKKSWIRDKENFTPDDYVGLRNSFAFVVENDLIKKF